METLISVILMLGLTYWLLRGTVAALRFEYRLLKKAILWIRVAWRRARAAWRRRRARASRAAGENAAHSGGRPVDLPPLPTAHPAPAARANSGRARAGRPQARPGLPPEQPASAVTPLDFPICPICRSRNRPGQPQRIYLTSDGRFRCDRGHRFTGRETEFGFERNAS